MTQKLVDAILAELHRVPLSATLSQVLRLADRTSDQELSTWARLELLGYTTENPVMTDAMFVPEYRTVRGQWFDVYNRPLVLDDPKLGFINEIRLRHGTSELESLAGATGVIALQLPEFSDLMRDDLHVEVSTFRFDPVSVAYVLSCISAQLLDRVARHRGTLETPPSTESSKAEILQLRPALYGIEVDLKALWKRWRSRSGEKGSA